MEGDLVLKKEDAIWTLTINRPEKRNTVYPDLLSRLERVFLELEDEPSVRAVVLRAAGDKAFCGGYDMTLFNPREERIISSRKLTEAIMRCSRPVIAMINGDCLGAGSFIAMACDIRITASHARFGYPPAKRGIIPTYWAVNYFIDMLGIANTKEILLLGRYFEAKRAREMGLVHFVVAKEELESFTYEMAAELSENAPLSIMAAKAIAFNRIAARWDDEKIPPELEAFLMTLSGKKRDFEEGINAFFEKRKPRFIGE